MNIPFDRTSKTNQLQLASPSSVIPISRKVQWVGPRYVFAASGFLSHGMGLYGVGQIARPANRAVVPNPMPQEYYCRPMKQKPVAPNRHGGLISLLFAVLTGLSIAAQGQSTNEMVLPIVINGPVAEKMHYQTIFTIISPLP